MAKIHRLVEDSRLDPFHEGIDLFCESHLRGASETETGGAKIFADPIEGYATLTSWEVSIINTPLFQRLRFIRQLGLTYLVYPTLGYSRFEHTLGVRARLDQVILHLHENLRDRNAEKRLQHLPEDEQLVAARLAAICHDIGHCLFSHVSESVINRVAGSAEYPSGQVIRDVYSEYAGKRVPMAEVMAVAIVTSNPFVAFLSKLGIPGGGTTERAIRLAHSAGSLIMGLPIPKDQTSLFLGQLLSSGLDVDKLDYMMRESHGSGISVGISLGWLLKKLMLFELPASEVPLGIKSRIDRHFEGDDRFVVLGLEKGGQFGFEEFCIARLTLHEKIYLHQKVRAAEAYLRKKLARLATLVPEFQEAHRWLYLRESIISNPDLDLPTLPNIQDSLLRGDQPRNANHLGLDKLFDRRLLYRAYAFGRQNAIAEPVGEIRFKGTSGTDNLLALIRQSPDDFEVHVRSNIESIRRTLLEDSELPVGDTELVIDPPRVSSIQQGHDTLFIERPSQLSLRWTIPIDKIVEYYHNNRALGYVFAPKEHLPLVCLASEKAAWDLFKVIYVQEGSLGKDALERVKSLKDKLHSKRFYDSAQLLQPVPKRLHTMRSQAQIRSIAEKLSMFDTRTKARVSPASTTAYVAQFPDELQDSAMAWLQHIDWIEPEVELVKAFAQIFEKEQFRALKNIALCPLGAASDSAYRIGYNLRDVARNFQPRDIRTMPLIEALAYGFDGYVFYDDNANTGLQAINIVAAWLGEELPSEIQLEEEHGFELPDQLKDELIGKPIGFAYAVATENAPERLLELLSKYTKLETCNVVCEAARILSKEEAIFNGRHSRFQNDRLTQLRDFLRDVATEMITVGEGKTLEEAQAKALGYNGAEAMVVFPYNCPTMTVTALWMRGHRKTGEWIPLVERARRTDPNSGKVLGDEV